MTRPDTRDDESPRAEARALMEARSPAEARFPVLVLVLLAILLFASRAPLVASAFRGSELTLDEPDLSLMALDRYFGAPMANTHWPAITNQMLMVPVIGIDFLKSGRPRNADGFAQYAGAMYRDPAPLVAVHRGLIVLLTTFATLCLAWSLRRRGPAAMIAAALLLQNVHLITYGTLGLGNGPALAAMIGCIAIARSGWGCPARSLLVGLLFGIAIASRNTSILFAPLLAGLAWEIGDTARARLRLLGYMILGAIAGSSPAWTLAMLEPIRWLKANLGNFVKIGPPVGLLEALRVLLSAAGVGYWLATVAAFLWLVYRRRDLGIVAGWLVAFIAAIVISARSPLVETRYFDAIVVGGVWVCVLAVIDLIPSGESRTVHGPEDRGGDAPALMKGGVLAIASLLAVIGIVQSVVKFNASRTGLRPEERAVAAAMKPAKGLTIVDRILLPPLKRRTASLSLRSLADHTDRAIHDGAALSEFVTRYKLDPSVASVFVGDLTEKEQGDIVRNRVAALAPPTGDAIELAACGETNTAQRFGVMATADVPAMLRDGRAEQAILPAETAATLDLSGLKSEPIATGKYVRITR